MSEWFEVRSSSIDEKGIFAVKPIPKGVRLIEYVGERVRGEVLKQRAERDRAAGRHYLFELGDGVFVDGLSGGNESIYINHSCEANCDVEFEQDRIWIVSLRDIAVGEELVYDYAFDLDDEPPTPCRCGSAHCRGHILSAEALAQLQRKSA